MRSETPPLTKEIRSELPLTTINFKLLLDPNFVLNQSRVYEKQENVPNFVSYYITIIGQKYIFIYIFLNFFRNVRQNKI